MKVPRRPWFAGLAVVSAALLPVGAAQAGTTVTGAATASVTAAARAPYCGLTWGSQAKSVTAAGSAASITGVRAGRHTCYDRFVVDNATWARVSYVATVHTEGQGLPIPLRGAADLQIITNRAESVTTGVSTFHPANRNELVNLAGFRTLRQAAFGGSFEGQSTLGLGVRARLPFRVFVLPAGGGQPSRVVIDVAHAW
jgi:hypothetical protein